MTNEELDTLERLHRAATQGLWTDPPERGEWNGKPGPYLVAVHERRVIHIGRFDYADNNLADKRFVAAAHNNMDYLLSAARREKVLREALEKALGQIESGPECCGRGVGVERNGQLEEECCGNPEYGFDRAAATIRAALSVKERGE